MKLLFPFALGFTALLSIGQAAKLRTDLPQIFKQFYSLTREDVGLDFHVGSAEFVLRDIFGKSFSVAMKEELSIMDTVPNADIEMCDGEAKDLATGETGG